MKSVPPGLTEEASYEKTEDRRPRAGPRRMSLTPSDGAGGNNTEIS